MKFISLFSGVGGMDLGLERAGMTCVAQVEIDEYATRVLARHWPDVPHFRDVRDVGRHNLPDCDLICGGFPCQPHSRSGRRLGSNDERDLWGEFARVIRELRPRWVLAENVAGLLSSENGRFFGRVLRDLAAGGFHVEWDCIPATFVGAVHQRERAYLVAYADTIDGQARMGHQQIGAAAVLNANRKDRDAVWLPPSALAPRGDNGVSSRFYRSRVEALGNAVVPQVAEYIGRQIMAATIKTGH